MLGSWTYSLSLSATWAREPREMHQVQWVPGMRMSMVPPGRNEMVQVLLREPKRSPGLRGRPGWGRCECSGKGGRMVEL